MLQIFCSTHKSKTNNEVVHSTQLSHLTNEKPHFFRLTNQKQGGEGRGGECMPGHTLLLLSSLPRQATLTQYTPDATPPI